MSTWSNPTKPEWWELRSAIRLGLGCAKQVVVVLALRLTCTKTRRLVPMRWRTWLWAQYEWL